MSYLALADVVVPALASGQAVGVLALSLVRLAFADAQELSTSPFAGPDEAWWAAAPSTAQYRFRGRRP